MKKELIMQNLAHLFQNLKGQRLAKTPEPSAPIRDAAVIKCEGIDCCEAIFQVTKE